MTDDRLYQLIVKRHYELRSIDNKGKIDIDQMNRMVWMNTYRRYLPLLYSYVLALLMISKHHINALKVDKKMKKSLRPESNQ